MNKLDRKSGLIELTLMFFIICRCSQQATPRPYVQHTGDTRQNSLSSVGKVLTHIKPFDGIRLNFENELST